MKKKKMMMMKNVVGYKERDNIVYPVQYRYTV